MNQLFYNLISNALKFSVDSVSPVIDISCRLLSEEELTGHPALYRKASYHKITFRDNGIGFEQKYEHQIFTIFQRLNQSGKYGVRA